MSPGRASSVQSRQDSPVYEHACDCETGRAVGPSLLNEVSANPHQPLSEPSTGRIGRKEPL